MTSEKCHYKTTKLSTAAPSAEQLVEVLRKKSEPFDDGYTPPLFRGIEPSRIVRHPQSNDASKSDSKQVYIIDNALPSDLVHQICEYVNESNEPAYGTYVTLNEAQHTSICESKSSIDNDDFQALARKAVFYFLEHIKKSVNNDIRSLDVHGVAVWWLASEVGSRGVAYHMDYAELVRYEYNLIVPPLYGAVLHCADFDIDGGEFLVNTNGLDHYAICGYKNESPFDVDDEGYWERISYKFNRLIAFNGECPHMSTKVNSLLNDENYVDRCRRRVIMGFNMFSNDVGPLIEAAPEHSPAFKARVCALQKTLQIKKKVENISIEKVKSSTYLSKLLVIAKREYVKRKLREDQERVLSTAVEILKSNPSKIANIREVIENISFLCRDISVSDIHMHLNSICRKSGDHEALISFMPSESCENLYDEAGLISLLANCAIP